eukprot:5487177-Prymnesium_polylepis.1
MHPLHQARGSRQVVHVGRGTAPCARVGRVARRVRGRVRPPARPDALRAAARARPPPAAVRLCH